MSDFKKVGELIDSWLAEYEEKMHQPSELFKKYYDKYPEIESLILNPRELLLETLEFFGLPRDYMLGMGHWKDWEKIKAKEKKDREMRRITKRAKFVTGKKKK